MTIFDDMVKLACEFVENQKGRWDHSAWLGFLSEAHKAGGRLTDDMQNYLGLMVESIRRFNNHISDAKKKVMDVVCEETVRFVEQTRGIWDHSGWENFLSNIKKKGIDLTSEAVAQLGNILESTKLLYKSMPADLKEEDVSSVEKEQASLESEAQEVKIEEEPEGEPVEPQAAIEPASVEPEAQKVEDKVGEEFVEPVSAQIQPGIEPESQAIIEQLENKGETAVQSDNISEKAHAAIDEQEMPLVIPTKIQKLTKKQLMELEEGSYLISHAVDETGNPVFAREVPSAEDREEFWLAVRHVSLNQRVCYIFKNKTDYVTFLAQK